MKRFVKFGWLDLGRQVTMYLFFRLLVYSDINLLAVVGTSGKRKVCLGN